MLVQCCDICIMCWELGYELSSQTFYSTFHLPSPRSLSARPTIMLWSSEYSDLLPPSYQSANDRVTRDCETTSGIKVEICNQTQEGFLSLVTSGWMITKRWATWPLLLIDRHWLGFRQPALMNLIQQRRKQETNCTVPSLLPWRYWSSPMVTVLSSQQAKLLRGRLWAKLLQGGLWAKLLQGGLWVRM